VTDTAEIRAVREKAFADLGTSTWR